MRAGAQNLVPYLVTAYTKGNEFSPEDWKKLDRYAEIFSVSTGRSVALPVHFLGIWDSVKALGILRRDPKWPYTRKLPNARYVFHAVSIDERRRPYAEYLVTPDPSKTSLLETWFAGVHSDVGGGFRDDPELARITLKWMADQAIDHGLLLRADAYSKLCNVKSTDATGRIHPNGPIWGLLGFRRRVLPRPGPTIHHSVKKRLAADPTYRIDIDLNAVRWDDPNWTSSHLALGGPTEAEATTSAEVVEP